MSVKISKSEHQRRQQHIEAWYSSGKSMRAYSDQVGLNYNSFKQWCYHWRKAHGIALTDKRTQGHFIPVSVVDKPSSYSGSSSATSGKDIYRFELKLFFGLFHFRIA